MACWPMAWGSTLGSVGSCSASGAAGALPETWDRASAKLGCAAGCWSCCLNMEEPIKPSIKKVMPKPTRNSLERAEVGTGGSGSAPFRREASGGALSSTSPCPRTLRELMLA